MSVHRHSWPVLVLLVCALGCSRKPAVDDTLRFEGEWQVLELTEKGKRANDQALKRLNVIVKDGQFQKVEVNDGAETTKVGAVDLWAVRVDNLKNPTQLD